MKYTILRYWRQWSMKIIKISYHHILFYFIYRKYIFIHIFYILWNIKLTSIYYIVIFTIYDFSKISYQSIYNFSCNITLPMKSVPHGKMVILVIKLCVMRPWGQISFLNLYILVLVVILLFIFYTHTDDNFLMNDNINYDNTALFMTPGVRFVFKIAIYLTNTTSEYL